jgi:hypothetical protein
MAKAAAHQFFQKVLPVCNTRRKQVAGAVKASKGADPVIVLRPQGEALEALVR